MSWYKEVLEDVEVQDYVRSPSLLPIRILLLQEISGAGIYFCKLEPRIPIQREKMDNGK